MSDQPSIPIPFAIGESLWLAEASRDDRVFPCPVCAGKRVLRVELGDGEVLAVACEGCSRGFEGSSGVCREYRSTYTPKPFTPRRVDVRGNQVTYSDAGPDAGGYTMYRPENLFRDREACEARCAVLAAEQERRIEESNAQSRMPKGKRGRVDIPAYLIKRREELRRELAGIEERLIVLVPAQNGGAA